MPITIHIPSSLRRFTQGHSVVQVQGHTVREVLQKLDALYPGILDVLTNTRGDLRRFVTLLKHQAQAQVKVALDSTLDEGDELSFASTLTS